MHNIGRHISGLVAAIRSVLAGNHSAAVEAATAAKVETPRVRLRPTRRRFARHFNNPAGRRLSVEFLAKEERRAKRDAKRDAKARAMNPTIPQDIEA